MYMIAKLKTCDICGKEKPIWKNDRTEGILYCKHCWSCRKSDDRSQKPRSAIPLVSSKKKKQDQEYLKLRERYLNDHGVCEVMVSGCSINATDIHHTYSGADRNVYYLIQSTWKSACRNCHNWIHKFPKEARILGYLK
jgi:hypothetical protein